MLLNSALISLFLSTPSARRATAFRDSSTIIKQISIHALREEGDADVVQQRVDFLISIPALREEGDSSPGLVDHH